MKTLARMVALLVVLGLCLPSSGEILVYKFTQNATYFVQEGGEWHVEKGPRTGYVVADVDYDDYGIAQAAGINYGRGQDGKWFKVYSLELELVRVQYGTKVQWVMVHKEVEANGEEIIASSFQVMVGQVRSRNIGAEVNREVATKLTGYGLEDQTEGGRRDIGMSTVPVTLYPAWTYWANGDEGNQDFDTTVQMIKEYLIDKGYTEEPT